jgi:hypothetical protein
MIPNATRWAEMTRYRNGVQAVTGSPCSARIHPRQNGGYSLYYDDGRTEHLTCREFRLLSGFYEDMAQAMAEGF